MLVAEDFRRTETPEHIPRRFRDAMIPARTRIARAICTFAVICPLVAGCVVIPLPSVGEQKDSDDLAAFEVGSTTRTEAVQFLEKPLIDDGRFVFDELHSDAGHLMVLAEGGGFRTLKKRLTRVLLEFDESNILKSMAIEAWSRAGAAQSGTIQSQPMTAPKQTGAVLSHRSGFLFKVSSVFKTVSFSPAGDVVAAATGKRVFLIDVESRTLAPFDPEDFVWRGSIESVDFSPDGGSLALLDRSIRIYDVDTRTETANFRGHEDISGRRSATALAFVPGENLVVSGGRRGFIRVWRATSGVEIASWRASKKRIHSIAVSTDGEMLATSDKGGFVRLWDRRSGKELGVVQRDGVVALSPDGRFLAIADSAHAELWRVVRDNPDSLAGPDSSTGPGSSTSTGIRLEGPQAMFVLPFFLTGEYGSWDRDPKWVTHPSLSFTPDSRMLVVGAGGMVIWDVAGGRRLLRRPTVPIADLAFSPDGRTMVTANIDGVRFWSLPSMTED